MIFKEVDIKKPENKKWLKYRYEIPVFHFEDMFFCKNRISKAELVKKIQEFTKANEKLIKKAP